MVESHEEFDSAFAFFDEVFGAIPTQYRQVHPDYITTPGEGKKPKQKDPRLSLAEINERAQLKIEELRRVNREKSQNKIAELTK